MGLIARYEYEPLQHHDSIRLFRLVPSTDHKSDIHGEIIYTTLSREVSCANPPHTYPSEATDCDRDEPYHPAEIYLFSGGYTALSYTWGNPEKNSTIFIDGKHLNITENLEQALRSLRLDAKTPQLWVDSVCINQTDDRERSQQVQQMCSIYKIATSTIIYLGPSNPISTSCFQSAAAGDDMELYDGEGFWGFEADPEALSSLKQGRDEILGRSWFTRAWTFQELVVSRRPWMCCGTTCLPWSQLCTYFLQKRRWDITLGRDEFSHETMFSNRWMWDPWGLDDTVRGRYSIIQDPASRSLQITTKGTMIMDKVRQIYQNDQPDLVQDEDKFSLFTLLEHRQGFAATDPRDAVFSLYGVLDKNDPIIRSTPVDYEKYTAEVFIDVTSALLSTDKSQEYGVFAHVENGRGAIEDLPSWVANWASARKYEQSIRSYVIEVHLHWPDREQPSDCKVYKDLNVVVCRGHQSLKRIQRLSDPLQHHKKLVRGNVRVTIEGTEHLVVTARHEGGAAGDSEIEIDGYNENGVGNFIWMSAACLSGRRLAQMDDGGLALVPEQAVVGDLICVLRGARVPFAIRGIGDKDANFSTKNLKSSLITDFEGRISSVGYYSLIGECWMKGSKATVSDVDNYQVGFVFC